MDDYNESLKFNINGENPGNLLDANGQKAKPDIFDGLFALFALILGYLFSRWVFFSWQGWGTALFTTLFCASSLIYMIKKGARLSKEAWFWLAVTWLTGLSFALLSSSGIEALRAFFLFCAAVYLIVTATSTQIAGKTGNLLLLDGINAVFVIPFRNIIAQYKCFSIFKSNDRSKMKKHLSILLGIILAVIMLLIVVPLLVEADSGSFTKLVNSISRYFSFDIAAVMEFLYYLIPAIPIAAYIFGLIYGCTLKKGHNSFNEPSINRAGLAVRVFPPVTIYILLGAVCALYIVFISAQLPYFFSAFFGERPAGWLYYSSYARHGFFELCQIVAINLSILTASNLLCKKSRQESRILRCFNILLMLLTLLLIATALSKMGLYIEVYGLTMLRLLTCLFMVFLAVVCIGVIVLQKVRFSIVRMSLIIGAAIVCLLCLGEPYQFVLRYNADRYLSGSLSEFDTRVLYSAGIAGVSPAIEVYQKTDDTKLQAEIREYLIAQKTTAKLAAGTYKDSLQNKLVLNKLETIELN